MVILITPAPFDPLDELRAFELRLGARRQRIGAQAMFVGSMRDFNDGTAVEAMMLEHYPGMTEAHLERLASEAVTKWQLDEVLIVHRVGEVRPGDPIVLVSTWSAHRAHAFESCRALMEELKSTAPLWKKELTAGGARWIENNTPGTSQEFNS